MNIQQIKVQIAQENNVVITALDLVRQFEDEAKTVPTDWLSAWIPEKRIRVAMHQDVLATIKTNPIMDTLALKKEVVDAHDATEEYTRYIVITPKHIVASL